MSEAEESSTSEHKTETSKTEIRNPK
jgi:hypothetical protein